MSSTAAEPGQQTSTGPTPDVAVPTPLRDWLRARPGRPVLVAAAAILLFQAGLRGWLGLRGYYFLDDFAFTGRAAVSSVFDHDYLLLAYNSHVMPGSFVWVWLLTKLAPFNFGIVVGVDLVLQVVLGIVFFRLLRALFGARPAILVPFVVGTMSAITLPAFLWWAAALNQLPEQIAMVTALLFQVRYLQTGRARSGVYGAVAVLAGLLFSEKSLFIVPLVVVFTLFFGSSGSARRTITSAVKRHLRVWLAYLAVVIPYTGYYLGAVPSPTHPVPDGAALGELFQQSFGHALIPGLLGGPWTWVQVGEAGALAAPSDFARSLALAVLGTVVLASIVVRRRAWFGWTMAFGYAVMNLAVLAVSRATFIGPVIGDEYRYVTDVAIVAALGGALSLLPLTGTWTHGQPRRIELRAGALNLLQHRSFRELRAAVPHIPERALVGLLVVAFTVSATVSSLAYDRYWRINPARPYVTTLRAQIAVMSPSTVLADERVPSPVAWALLGDYAFESHFLAPLPSEPKFLEPGETAEDLHVIDADGRIKPSFVEGVRSASGPEKGCGWRLGPQALTIPMKPASFPGYWTVRIGYIATEATSASVLAGNTSITVPFRRGLGAVSFLATGTVSTVKISGLATGASVCTNDVSVGTPIPVPGAP